MIGDGKRWGMSGKMGCLPHPASGETHGVHRIFLGRGSRDGFAVPRLPNGSIWMPTFGLHNIHYFSKAEAFQLVSCTKLPLAGHNEPATEEWLSEPGAEEWLSAPESCQRGEICADNLCLALPIGPHDVHAALFFLLRAYDGVEMRQLQVLTRTNFEHHQTAAKRLKSAINALEKARERTTSAGDLPDEFLLECMARAMMLTCKADYLDRRMRSNGDNDNHSLEDFVRGPLAHWYTRLVGRAAAGNERGPFARFGRLFFNMVGHPVAPGTIVRAVKPHPKRRMRR